MDQDSLCLEPIWYEQASSRASPPFDLDLWTTILISSEQ